MESLIVLGRITTLSLLIAAGWYARRRGYVGAEETGTIGRLVVELCLPALVFVQMVSTVDRATWQKDWISVSVGGVVMLLALGTG
ncbi:MAG: hypothetical protein MUF54_12760, partial [Polyangiaceae bacterium]|nr:hypothetical protein [Polyangiaceae bacterium]